MVARLFFNCYIFNYYRNERLKKEKSEQILNVLKNEKKYYNTELKKNVTLRTIIQIII